ncbi:MAG: recombinase family protein [Rhizobiaceae bacterium]
MKPESQPTKAVIYCRQASARRGHAEHLAAQEARCREYARLPHYEVVATFCDLASGMTVSRPELDKMLAWLGDHRSEPVVVLVDDIAALARSVEAYVSIRDAIHEMGASLESPSRAFDVSNEGVLADNLRAALVPFEGARVSRKDGGRQVRTEPGKQRGQQGPR